MYSFFYSFGRSIKSLLVSQEIYVRWGLIVTLPIVVIIILGEYVRRFGGFLYDHALRPCVELLGWTLPKDGWLVNFWGPILALCATIFILWLIGFVIQRKLINPLYSKVEGLLQQIPVLGVLHSAIKNGVAAFLNSLSSGAQSVEISFGGVSVLGMRTHKGKCRSVVSIATGNCLIAALVENLDVLEPQIPISIVEQLRLNVSAGQEVPPSVKQYCDLPKPIPSYAPRKPRELAGEQND